jgi:hypothetical protein
MKFYEEEYNAADKQAFYETVPTRVLEECQNCGRLCEELVYLEGWDFRACPTCARECQLTDEAERLCPSLYEQVIRANGVREIEAVFKAHPGSQCPSCGVDRKQPQADQTHSRDLNSTAGSEEVA